MTKEILSCYEIVKFRSSETSYKLLILGLIQSCQSIVIYSKSYILESVSLLTVLLYSVCS